MIEKIKDEILKFVRDGFFYENKSKKELCLQLDITLATLNRLIEELENEKNPPSK